MDIYGIIGWPVKHSLSPAMHNAAFKKLGIDAEYRKFEVKPEGLEDFLLKRKDVKGFNITIPHKVRAKEIIEKSGCLHFLQREDYPVRMCGAINTVKRVNDKIQHANTDVYGFRDSLKKDLSFDYGGKKIFLIGCGGAGRAGIAGLTWRPHGSPSANKIYIYESNKKAVESLKQYFSGWTYVENIIEFVSKEKMPELIKNCQLLVNASPIGMKEGDDSSPIDKQLLHKDLSVYDVVYNRKTQLIKDAEANGLRSVGGLGMFLYQGVRAFEFWTGEHAPVDVMREELKKALK